MNDSVNVMPPFAAPASQQDASTSAGVQYMRDGSVKTWRQRAWEDGCDTDMQPDPKHYTDQMLEEIAELRAVLYSGFREGRNTCTNCDGSGQVHRADGEYMGECNCLENNADGNHG